MEELRGSAALRCSAPSRRRRRRLHLRRRHFPTPPPRRAGSSEAQASRPASLARSATAVGLPGYRAPRVAQRRHVDWTRRRPTRQLSDLMRELEASQVQFIQCIQPPRAPPLRPSAPPTATSSSRVRYALGAAAASFHRRVRRGRGLWVAFPVRVAIQRTMKLQAIGDGCARRAAPARRQVPRSNWKVLDAAFARELLAAASIRATRI